MTNAKDKDFKEFGAPYYNDLLNDDHALYKWVKIKLVELQQYNKRFATALTSIHLMQELFNSPTLKKPMRTLYGIGLSGKLVEDNHLSTCISLFKYYWH